MSGVNKVIIIGNLGADPEVRFTTNGTAVANLRVATTEKWVDHEGEKQERTEWHSVAFFGKLAEICGEYLKKGRQIYVEGKLQTDKYTDKEGVEKYQTKIVGLNMQMLGQKDERGSDDRPPRDTRRAAKAPAGKSDNPDDHTPF